MSRGIVTDTLHEEAASCEQKLPATSCQLPAKTKATLESGSRHSAVGSRRSALGIRQSAVGNCNTKTRHGARGFPSNSVLLLGWLHGCYGSHGHGSGYWLPRSNCRLQTRSSVPEARNMTAQGGPAVGEPWDARQIDFIPLCRRLARSLAKRTCFGIPQKRIRGGRPQPLNSWAARNSW